MIPKIIHYCWFGNKEKPDIIKRCINSWKEILSDYEIIEWNEKNYDLFKNKFCTQAYEQKKFAFVSDVVRLDVMYEYGGIYLDTDVMVYKTFDEILDNKCVFGFEEKEYVATSFMAAEKKCEFIERFLEYYQNQTFIKDKKPDMETNVVKLTKLLLDIGLKKNGEFQVLPSNIVVYPQVYFSPYDYINCYSKRTNETICEHLFNVSWQSKNQKIKKIIKSTISNLGGYEILKKLRKED
mgnify:CR=1 FL=1